MENTEKRKNLPDTCTHCQKANLICDKGRPCQGCVKRNLMNTCTDRNKKCKTDTDTPSDELYSPTANVPFTPADQPLDTSSLFNLSFADFGFGSEATGLEYNILSSISVNDKPDSIRNTTNSPTLTIPTTTEIIDTTSSNSQLFNALSSLFPFTSPSASTINQPVQMHFQLPKPPTPTVEPPQRQPSLTYTSPVQKNAKRDSVASTVSTSSSTAAQKSSTGNRRKGNNGNTPEAVYNSVRKPFNYAEGFHYLIQYVTERMRHDDLMRISRALSFFRPSFLSLIMNLTEEDLIFMERCFQRTLLEYEKLISFSGTPTVVWRRTGEVCLVGKEFSLLTQWTRDMLLNKKTYIYELMENQSAVEYWEKFSIHAFDNTDKACSYSCILRTPQQKPVPCTFCFTIKRDIFDLPSVIVGNVSSTVH
ncbi:Transcription activator of gluconeogenesis ERT1 [Choanephora cucurbitarum]|uniref:Transcription activator of gluconeogenesis ERT1 n=1 Tax=Choanephora cucurbitarum TaxID=101091 RepID=A0A1C7N0B4_9FUNG|nr:Transcription activator of gluconeogenesis ERT1 [Choanephora cucurbitarum]